MISTVTKLYDYRQSAVPEDMTKWHVGPDELEEQLNTLARVHAAEFQADTVRTGDSVRLTCPGHRDVLLYPGLSLPGAQKAEEAVVGLHVRDPLTSPINGTPLTMTVAEILRRAPAAIDDSLAQAEHIDGVSTLEEYRRWYQAKTEEENKSSATKNIAFFLMDEIQEKSEYAIDQAELDDWAGQRAQQVFDESIAMGEDPHIPDEGLVLLTDEEAIEQIKSKLLPEFKMLRVCEELCRQKGISTAWEDLRAEFEQFMPPDQEGIAEEERAQAKAMFLESAPATKAFDWLREQAEQYLED